MRKLIRKGTIGLKIPSFKGLYTPSFNYSYSDFKKATSKEYPELEYFNSLGRDGIHAKIKKSSEEDGDGGEESTDEKEPSKFSKLMHSKGMDIALQTAGAIADMVPSMDKVHNENDKLSGDMRNTVENALMKSGNPYAMAAGVASKIIGKTGGYTDASKGLGTTNDTLNTIASFAIPGAGWFTKKTKDMELDSALQASSAYTGSADYARTASQNAGAKILFGRSKANNMIDTARYQQERTSDILSRAEMDRYGSANPLVGQRVQMQMSGGYNPLVAKVGAKLYNIEFARKALLLKKGGKATKRNIIQLIQYAKQVNPRFIQRMDEPVKAIDLGDNQKGTHLLSWGTDDNGNAIVYPEIQEVNGELKYFENPKEAYDNAVKNNNILIMTPEEAEDFTVNYKQGWPEFFRQFKNGGSFNVIPEGALHKNKHHLENVDSKFEEVTTKGIPVISESKDGNLIQHAEVEKEEIIFRLEVTKKLEELAKKDTDEAAIEAGKLLVTEILHNTIDKTNNML